MEDPAEPRVSADIIGGDLSTLSVGDIDERIELLKGEIARLEKEKSSKVSHLSAAEAFFKKTN